MADSVGKGIALGERFKYDTTSGTKMLNDALQYKVASDRKKEADAVSSLDFKIDYKNLLPAYGKRIAEIATEPLNKYAQYKKEDPRTAMNRVQADFYEAQQKIGRLTRDNEAAKNYLSQKAGFAKNPDLVNALISTDSDFEAISKFNNGDFLNIGKDGEFAFRPIEVMNPSAHVKYDNEHDYDKRFGGTKPIGIAGKTQIEQIEAVKPEAIARNAVSLTTNPQFRDNVLLSRPDLIGLPEKEQYGAIYNEAFKISTQLARAPKSEWKIVDLPNPTSSGSGDKDKREKPIIGGESTESLSVGTTGGGKSEIRKDVYYPWSADVPGSPETAVPLDSRVIDYETNKFISGDALGKIATFKPKKIYPQLIKGTGKTELYVIGTAQVEVTVGRNEKVIKEFNYKVPYDKVKDAIGAKYDLTDVDEKMKNTNLKPASSSQKQPEAPKQTQSKANVSYKYKRTNSKGVSIFSPDNQTWYDDKGNIIK